MVIRASLCASVVAQALLHLTNPYGLSATVLSLQLGANALLFVGVNMYGVFVRILTERSQRKAFLQARSCIEDRLRLEDENEKQVSVFSTRWPFGQLCPSPS